MFRTGGYCILVIRVRNGHTHATHSYLMKSREGRQASVCNSSHVSLNVKLIVIECPAFDQEIKATSLHGSSLSKVLGNNCHINNLLMFLKNTVFYYNF